LYSEIVEDSKLKTQNTSTAQSATSQLMEDNLAPDSRESLDCKKLDGDGELLVELRVGMTTPTFTEQHLHFDTNNHSCQRASSPDAVHALPHWHWTGRVANN
jgi:hypothetical protein